MLCGLGDGEPCVCLDGVAQRGVHLVAFLVGLAQGGGAVAGAVLLEGLVLALEGRAELLDGLAPEFAVHRQRHGTLAHALHVLEVRRVARPRDGDLVYLHRDFHDVWFLKFFKFYFLCFGIGKSTVFHVL